MFLTLPDCPGGGGEGAQLEPSRMSVVLVEETNAGDTSRRECPCEDQEKRPLAGTNKKPGGTVSEGDIRSPCGGGGGRCPLPFLLRGSFWLMLRLMLRMHQRCLLRDLGWFPRGFRWCWSMGPGWGHSRTGVST